MSDDERNSDIESDAGKRAHHNARERKRRDHINDCFSSLKNILLEYDADNKVLSSKAQILTSAANHIQLMQRKNADARKQIDNLIRENNIIEEQLRKFEEFRDMGNFDAAEEIMESICINNQCSIAYEEQDSEKSSVDCDFSLHLYESNKDIMEIDEPPRKREKRKMN